MFNTLQSPDGLLEQLRVDLSHQVGIYLSKLVKAELSEHLGREPYERSGKHTLEALDWEKYFSYGNALEVNTCRESTKIFTLLHAYQWLIILH